MEKKHLADLLEDIVDVHKDDNIKISSIAGCIQDCQDGSLFVADTSETIDLDHTGYEKDGVDFIEQAIRAGAKAILTRPNIILQNQHGYESTRFFYHPSPIKQLGTIASRFYDHQHPDFIGAVTGTNGKTSTVNFAAQLFQQSGQKSVAIGNLGIRAGGTRTIGELQNMLSVPETVEIHRLNSTFYQQRFQALFTEATSHALHYYRLHGMHLDAAAFTNLTHDHLDFHHTMEKYFQTKATLFTQVLNHKGVAILNTDMHYHKEIKELCQYHNRTIYEYGTAARDLTLISCKTHLEGLSLVFQWHGQTYNVVLPMYGDFNAYNVLCALAFTDVAGISPDDAINALGNLEAIESRMEFVPHPHGYIFLDAAHSPDALEKVLITLNSMKINRLMCVLSCDGERDIEKRPLMVSIAHKYCDHLYITDGLARSESATDIRHAMLKGKLPDCNHRVEDIQGRSHAIKQAIKAIGEHDILLICGMITQRWKDPEQNNRITSDIKIITDSIHEGR